MLRRCLVPGSQRPRSLTQSADARWDSGRAEVPPTPAPCQRAPTCSQGSGWLTSRTPCSRPTRGPTGETDASTLESHGPARHWMWLHINAAPWWTPGRGRQKRRQRSLPLANVTGSRGAAVPTRLVLNLSSSKLEEAERFAASPGRASTARRTPRVQTGWRVLQAPRAGRDHGGAAWGPWTQRDEDRTLSGARAHGRASGGRRTPEPRDDPGGSGQRREGLGDGCLEGPLPAAGVALTGHGGGGRPRQEAETGGHRQELACRPRHRAIPSQVHRTLVGALGGPASGTLWPG